MARFAEKTVLDHISTIMQMNEIFRRESLI